MTSISVLNARYPRAAKTLGKPVSGVRSVGHQAIFYRDAVFQIPHAMLRYRKDAIRLIAEIGGTVVIVGFMTFSAGTLLAIQGFASLGDIGVEALTGFFAAYINVRIAAPVTAGIALAATIGAGSTAQLGAMRIAEEVDALEVMAIRSMSYLVSTRMVAGVIAIIPLYTIAVLMSFLASRTYTIFINGQSAGVYDHYFATFLRPADLIWSFMQAVTMGIVVMGIHCYHGYMATGGPAGVGEAVGRAVRSSLVAVVVVCLLVSLAVYGTSGNFNLAG